jgi:hypothetical protein
VVGGGAGGGGGAGDDVVARVGAGAVAVADDSVGPAATDAAVVVVASELNADVDEPAVQPARAATSATTSATRVPATPVLRKRCCMAHPLRSEHQSRNRSAPSAATVPRRTPNVTRP